MMCRCITAMGAGIHKLFTPSLTLCQCDFKSLIWGLQVQDVEGKLPPKVPVVVKVPMPAYQVSQAMLQGSFGFEWQLLHLQEVKEHRGSCLAPGKSHLLI